MHCSRESDDRRLVKHALKIFILMYAYLLGLQGGTYYLIPKKSAILDAFFVKVSKV